MLNNGKGQLGLLDIFFLPMTQKKLTTNVIHEEECIVQMNMMIADWAEINLSFP